MAQHQIELEHLGEWEELAKKIVEKYPERYGHIDLTKIIAYMITNKPEKSDTARPYEMQTDKLPMRLTNTYEYFIWFKHPEMWHDKPPNVKSALVISATRYRISVAEVKQEISPYRQ